MGTRQGPALSVGVLSSGADPSTIVIVIGGRIEPENVDALCEHVCLHLQSTDATSIVCDLRSAQATDAVAVDALARLQLAARREGRRVELRNASSDLLSLLRLSGLDGVLPARDP